MGKSCIRSNNASIHPCIDGPSATASEYGRYPPVWLRGKPYTFRDLVYEAHHVARPSLVGGLQHSIYAERPLHDTVRHHKCTTRILPLKLMEISQMSTSILTLAYNYATGYLWEILFIDCVQRLAGFR